MQKIQLPLRRADGTQFPNADALHSLLEKENSGFYLLSKHGFWHGGVHLSESTAPQCLRQEPLRCIADGEVVAYRLNRNYLQSTFEGSEQCTELRYSTSFCLVRHTFEAADPQPVKSSVSPETESENTADDLTKNVLTFYSLYMHLLPFSAYDAADDTDLPRVKVINGGWPARNLPLGEDGSHTLGMIGKGTEIEILERRNTRDGRYEFARGRIIEGKVGSRNKGEEVWFAIGDNGKPIMTSRGRQRLIKVPKTARTAPVYWQGKVRGVVKAHDGLQVYSKPEGATPRPLSDFALHMDSQVEFDSGEIELFVIDGKDVQMAECTAVPGHSGLRGAGTLPEQFWLNVDSEMLGRDTPTPQDFANVIVPKRPIPIRAADPVGYLGTYEVPAGLQGGKRGSNQVHLEIFACDTEQLNSFLDNAAGLKSGKQYLEIPAWTPIFEKLPVPASTTQIYPHIDHVLDLKSLAIYKDSKRIEWYEVALEEKGRSLNGLINNANASVTHSTPRTARLICQHDLRKLGWRTVSEPDENSGGYLEADRVPHFFESLNPSRDKLFSDFDVNEDCRISADELKAALRNPALRPHWSRLIAQHPTEWKAKSGSPARERFRDLLKDAPEVLRHESERIDNLVFWDEIAEKVGLPKNGRVWHFHPVEFLGHLMPPEVVITQGQVTYDAEGNDIPTSRGFSRVIHWPGNDLSGVTLGRGYDMGSRSEGEVFEHMIGAGISEAQASKISKAYGLKGEDAKRFVIQNKIDVGEITIEQQIMLFEFIYPAYVARAVKIYDKYTASKPGRYEWNALSQPVRDILVDFVYQGFATKNPMTSGVNNDIDEMIRYIRGSEALMKYEGGRRRVEYLIRAKEGGV